jgi:PAS domain S-box-containing protein
VARFEGKIGNCWRDDRQKEESQEVALNEANDQNEVVLANLPAGPKERRIAFSMGLLLLAIGVVTVPFGTVQLPMSDAWVPIAVSFMIVADFLTWFLLISQFRIVRSRALLVIASGYLFSATINIPILLTFPGVFSPTGLLHADFQSPLWLGLSRLAGYSIAAIFYAVMKKEPRVPELRGSSRTAVAASVAVVIGIVLALTWITTAGVSHLPNILRAKGQSSAEFQFVVTPLSLLTATALLLLWFRRRTVLDLWLMVATCAWLAQEAVKFIHYSSRNSLSFYASTGLLVISSTVLLVVLLKETMTLYGRLAVSLVTVRRLSAEKLQRSEAYLSEAQRLSHTGSFGRNVSSGEIHWSEETYRIFELDRSVKPTLELLFERIHPNDRRHVQKAIDRATNERTDFDVECRLLRPDGSVKYLHVVAQALEHASGELEFVGAVTDITAAKEASEALRQSESYLTEAQGLAHMGSGVWSVPGWEPLYLSEEWYRIYGFDPELGLSAWQDRLQRMHPDDQAKVQEAKDRATNEKSAYEVDHRIILPDGTVKYTHTVGHPVLNASGDVEQFVCTMMDVTESKRAEEALRKAFEEIKALKDQLYQENIALKEEVDRVSMFEEIVGASPALRVVLSRVSKVAPTDSTVLITGETGTGKELIARAVHRRSQRSSRTFVSVNCAAIPRDLIASELFGHEKGAFTGALQRRLGRFEMAEGGTIFLDEIGELPAETQIALLRVLQEREFERVGGTASIRTNIRVIAATNRDLQAAIAVGTFRSDLFYRLNVFPIEVPPLRERREDIPVLVAYFVDRYARKAGKHIRSVTKKSLELLLSYPWPGNIRELQNIIERSVIVCDTESLSVEESWLSRQPSRSTLKTQPELSRKLANEEKWMIESALRECGGRVSGPSGAAVRLGIPGSTLDSKIRALRIDKNRFKSPYPSTDLD